MTKYLRSVRPILNDEEFASTTALVKDFEKGVGQQLQVRKILLKSHIKSIQGSNYRSIYFHIVNFPPKIIFIREKKLR